MKKILLLAALFPLFASAQVFLYDSVSTTTHPGDLLTGLNSYYRLENVNDYFTGALHLTNVGTSLFSAGKVYNAVDFGASNSTKYLSSDNGHNYTGGAYSFGGLINVTTAPGAGERDRIFMSGSTATEISLDYIDDGGTKKAEFYRQKSGGADFYTVNQTFNTGTWYCFYGTYDAFTLRMYVDGVEIGTGASSTTSGAGATQGYRIGADTSNSSLFSGSVDEAGVWTRALSQTDITNLCSKRGNRMVDHRLRGGAISR